MSESAAPEIDKNATIVQENTSETAEGTPLSKQASKKLKRKLQAEAEKPARRAKERALKKEKKALKRSIAEVEGAESGAPDKKPAHRKPFNTTIVIDLEFDDKMSEGEIRSLSSQLSFSYGANRASMAPVNILMTSLNGNLEAKYEKSGGYHKSWKNVEWWKENYENLWRPEDEKDQRVEIGSKSGQTKAYFKKEDVIYLTGDSPNVLEKFEEGKAYIIGGIVDHNRYKNLCLNKAQTQGIQTAQLPIREYLPEMLQRRVLAVNHVVDIITKWTETKDWETSLKHVMPARKFEAPQRQSKVLVTAEEATVPTSAEVQKADCIEMDASSSAEMEAVTQKASHET